jgi:2-polyprenyl-3-methyl-5-hydroxy-6-metoxy-1,4-benzoquinol methylase
MLTVSEKTYANQGNAEVLNEVFRHLKAGRILDVGCGVGDNARILSHKGYIVDGITISVEEGKMAKPFLNQVFIKNLEEGLPKLEYKYDVIICSHVLEHIAFPTILLSDLRSVLETDGVLIVALPNLMHYRSRFKLLMGNFDYEVSGVWDETHLRWYTFKTGKELLLKHGFAIEKAWVSGDLPLLSFSRVIPVKFRKRLFDLLAFTSKGLFGGQLLYTAKLPNEH